MPRPVKMTFHWARRPMWWRSMKIGRHVILRRNPDYWGNALPLRRGTHNFDEIRIEFYGDDTVMKEAFKARSVSYVRELNAEKWETNMISRRCNPARS